MQTVDDYVLGLSVELPEGYHIERVGQTNQIEVHIPDRSKGVKLEVPPSLLEDGKDYESLCKTVSRVLMRAFERVEVGSNASI